MLHRERFNALTLLVLFAGVLITGVLWRYTHGFAEEERRQRFELMAVQAEDALTRRVQSLSEVLLGMQSVFFQEKLPSRAEFRRTVHHNDLLTRYPGIQVVGFIQHFTADRKAAYESAVRSDRSVDPSGYRHFSIHPPGERSDYQVITYVEPMSGNEKAFGLDIGSEPVRREAFEMARDTGKIAATGRIKLVQETGTQSGLLLMAPLYRVGMPLQTVDQRRAAFLGLVYFGLRVGDLVDKTFGGYFLDSMDLTIFGVPQPGEGDDRVLLFDSRAASEPAARAGLSRDGLLEIGGRQWQLIFASKERLPGTGGALPWLVLFSGVAISLLLAWLVRTLANSSQHAFALADQMTRQFRDSELRSRTVLDNVLDGIITIDERGIVESFNRAAEQIFGYRANEVVGRNVKMLMPEPYHSQHDAFLSNYISSGVPKIIGIGREVAGLRKDGASFPMDLAVTETWLEGHHIFTGIVRDLTQRKQVEEMMSSASRLNQAILDSADDSIISTDTEGTIQTFNRGAELMLGYSAIELVGKFTPALFHDMQEIHLRAQALNEAGMAVEPGFEVFVAVARQGRSDSHEWTYIRKDGSRLAVLLTVTALRDEHGGVTGFLGIARDITEQKKVAQELRESSESVARAQQIAHFGSWDWNIESGSLRWSDEIYRIFGVQPQQFAASYEAFVQAVHPDDRDMVRNAVDAALTRRMPYSIEHRVVRPDGSERTVHEQGEALFDDQGRPIRMLGTVQDITERKHFVDELQKLSQAVEQSPVSVVITDAAGNIEYVNAKFSEVTGYVLAEVIGQNPRILQSGLTSPAVYLEMWQKLKEGGEWRGKFCNRRKNGEIFWEEAIISSIRSHEGVVTHYIGVKEDITERVRIEEDLERANRRNELILNAVEEGIYGVDLAGSITFINPSAANMLGYSSAELLGGNSHPIFHHSHQDGAAYPDESCPVLAAMRQDQVRQVSNEVFWRKDGSFFPVDYVAAPLREAGHVVGAVVAFRDVTEHLKVERMKNEFIATVSHELRTPLTSIRGSLALIAGGVAGELPPQARTMVEIAHKNSERLILLVNDILDMEKIESGRMPFDFKPADLVQLVEHALETNRAYGAQFGVSFVLEQAAPGQVVNVDSHRILQVLANLLSNAAKFSPPGESVRVSVKTDDGWVRVSVSDHGQGIPEEFRGRIFQRFSQVDSSDARQKGGTGLGLSIAKAMIEKMGGRIDYETRVGSGTTFFIELPLWREES